MTTFNQDNQTSQINQTSQDNQKDRTMELQKKMNALLMPALESLQWSLKEGEGLYELEEVDIYTLDMRFSFDVDEYNQALEDGDKIEEDEVYNFYIEEKGGEIELPVEIIELVEEYCEYFLQLDVSCDVEKDRIFVSSKAYVSFA